MAEVATKPQKGKAAELTAPKFLKPDLEEHRKKKEAHEQKINNFQAELNKIQSQMTALSGGASREEFFQQKAQYRLDCEKIENEIKQYEDERKRLVETITKHVDNVKNKRAEVVNIKKNLHYQTEEEIDETIRELQRYMTTTTVSLKQEKEYVQKLQKLQRMKPDVRGYSQLERDVKHEEENQLNPMKARLDVVRKALNDLRGRKIESVRKLQDLAVQREKETSPFKDLIDARNKMYAQINSVRKEVAQLNFEYDVAMKKHQDYLNEQKRQKRAVEQATRKKLQLNDKKEELEETLLYLRREFDYDRDAELVIQTIKYIQRMVREHRDDKQCDDSALDNRMIEENFKNEGGDIVIIPKKQRGDDYFFAPQKKAKKKDKKAKKNQNISHQLGALTDFRRIGINAPMTYHETEKCLEELNGKLVEIKKVQERKKNENVELIKTNEAKLADIIQQIEESSKEQSPKSEQRSV